jgi:hypothetical protein
MAIHSFQQVQLIPESRPESKAIDAAGQQRTIRSNDSLAARQHQALLECALALGVTSGSTRLEG